MQGRCETVLNGVISCNKSFSLAMWVVSAQHCGKLHPTLVVLK